MRAGRGSVRTLKKFLMKNRGNKKSSRAIRRSSTYNHHHPAITNTSVPDKQITNNNFPPLPSAVDANNNVIASSASNTNTLSESGPLLKVVVSPQRGPVELLDNTEGATIIYTDASVVKDGTAGIGVYYGAGHPLNLSERLPGKHRSSGWAEVIAATTSLQRLQGWNGYTHGPVIIRTDCLNLVEAMQKNQISRADKFFVEYQTLKKIAQDFPQGVQFEHVYAHNGDEGNEAADALATQATSKYNTPSPRRTRKKAPSEKTRRRTRSVYIKRSAPAKIAGGDKKMKQSPKVYDWFNRSEATTQQPSEADATQEVKQTETDVTQCEDNESMAISTTKSNRSSRRRSSRRRSRDVKSSRRNSTRQSRSRKDRTRKSVRSRRSHRERR